MSALAGIRARAEAAAKIPHHRTGPGKCACGFDAYKVGYYVYDYGEERQRHEDAARRAAKKQDTDALRLLAAIDAALALADVADKRAASNYGEGKLRRETDDQDASAFQALALCQTQMAHEIRAAVNDALEGAK